MASNPPFELEDQTDEDFFDKLVNDEDDDEINVNAVSSKSIELIKSDDVSDELQALANLTIANNNVLLPDLAAAKEEQRQEEYYAKPEPSFDVVTSNLEVQWSGFTGSSMIKPEAEPEPELELVAEPEPSANVATSDLDTPTSGGVKEVQWSAFTGSSMIDSSDDFFTSLAGGDDQSEMSGVSNVDSSYSQVEYQGVVGNQLPQGGYTNSVEYQGVIDNQLPQGGDTNSVEYWEALYPGWKYDPVTAQWYQADDAQGGFVNESVVMSSQVLQPQFGGGTVAQAGTTEAVLNWNYVQDQQQQQQQQQSSEFQYPAHMYLDPSYPGWYYDMIAQEWRSLEAYHASLQSIDGNRGVNNDHSSLGLDRSLGTSMDYSQQAVDPQFGLAGGSIANSTMVQSWQGSSGFNMYSNNQVSQVSSNSIAGLTSNERTIQSNDNSNWGSFSACNKFPLTNQSQQVHQNGPLQYPTNALYSNQQSGAVVQPFFPNGHNVSYSPSEGRSSAGRPPHALVTFGFGGKLVVMKDSSSGFSGLGTKNGDGCSLSVLNLMEVVKSSSDTYGTKGGAFSYFNSLRHQSFPGPLVGGNVGSKELYKWIDERLLNCESLEMNRGDGQGLKLLLSLLKIACQHYGKLRSYGGDTGSKENDPPEFAVAKLFASAKRNVGQYNDYNATTKCLISLPSEAQSQAIAAEVQNLLISGRQMEALQRAQEGQLWGFALILARLLGEQFYADTVKQMAVSQLATGSPLRTLCLLVARNPEEVFVNSLMPSGNVHGAVHMSQHPVQSAGCGMLENWEENLAVITANRTENDHLVITHLGDCLLKENSDVTAAHICYLIADAGFELYSESSRLCLIGADHWNFPRTYASPEAIQRTELFEYAKVLGNSQFVLLQLQPYKLIYAHMLAEVGRVSDSLKYCQAIYKSLRIGRSPEADSLKQFLASLEERIKTHQQSGYTVNLAPTKIVGKLLNFFDSTAHRVVGGLPPPGPSTMQNSIPGNENKFQSPALRGTDVQSNMGVSALTTSASMDSQLTMGMSALTPSASMEPISQWAVDKTKMTMQNRSISEPDIGRTSRPDQVNSSDEAASKATTVGKQTGSTGTSRFGRFNFGAQILQKTVGLVLKPRQGRQAKLGDTNKFYYDEKLKRWVEEGAEPPPEEAALPPPPTAAAFQYGNSEYNLKNALNSTMDGSPGSVNSIPESSPGIPSTPPISNQFSARGRLGVRSRYVDTFNKGSSVTSMNPTTFQTPSVPSLKPANLTAAKFFVPMAAPEPMPAPTNDETFLGSSNDQVSEGGENSGMSMNMNMNEGFQKQKQNASPVVTLPRFSSTGNLPSSTMNQSRRTASWSAFQNPASIPPEIRPASPGSSIAPMPNYQSQHLHRDPSGDDLQDVEL